MSEKITIITEEEIPFDQLNEREKKIYEAGQKDGYDDGMLRGVIIMTVIVAFCIIMLSIKTLI